MSAKKPRFERGDDAHKTATAWNVPHKRRNSRETLLNVRIPGISGIMNHEVTKKHGILDAIDAKDRATVRLFEADGPEVQQDNTVFIDIQCRRPITIVVHYNV